MIHAENEPFYAAPLRGVACALTFKRVVTDIGCDRVVAGFALERIVSGAAVDCIGSTAACDRIDAVIPADNVIEAGSLHGDRCCDYGVRGPLPSTAWGSASARWRRPTQDGWLMLVPEPTKQSSEAAKLDLLILEPGVQSTVGHRGRCIAAIKRVCLIDDGVIARIALDGGLRTYGFRFLGPDWIARHHRFPCLM